jgi:hypothetical protein
VRDVPLCDTKISEGCTIVWHQDQRGSWPDLCLDTSRHLQHLWYNKYLCTHCIKPILIYVLHTQISYMLYILIYYIMQSHKGCEGYIILWHQDQREGWPDLCCTRVAPVYTSANGSIKFVKVCEPSNCSKNSMCNFEKQALGLLLPPSNLCRTLTELRTALFKIVKMRKSSQTRIFGRTSNWTTLFVTIVAHYTLVTIVYTLLVTIVYYTMYFVPL